MAKKSKGFSDLLKQQRKQTKRPAEPKPKITILRTNEDNQGYVESNFEGQEQRIGEIVGLDEDGEVLEVNDKTLATYRDYLEKHLEFPCYLTGIEDLGCFGWEEYYTIGPGSKKDHERLRKTKPSYLDTYEFLGFEDRVKDEFYGLLVTVKRMSDNKKFCLPLSDLKATDEKPKNYQLLDDYAVWFVNWR